MVETEKKNMMNETEVKEALLEVKRELGDDILTNAFRVNAFLADLLPDSPGVRRMLVQLLEDDVPRQLSEGRFSDEEDLAGLARYWSRIWLWDEAATLQAARVWRDVALADVGAADAPAAVSPPARMVECPLCGKRNLETETFRCRDCGRDKLCLRHQDQRSFLCSPCEEKRREPKPPPERFVKGMVLGLLVLMSVGVGSLIFLEARKKRAGVEKLWTNNLGMEFVLVKPRHQAMIGRPFYLGRHEVTQAQWEEVMGNNPSAFKHPDHPVENVSWTDAEDFIRRLNEREGHNRYRLPTEAEWEYAARGDGDQELGEPGESAWCGENWSEGATHAVGSTRKANNKFGLRDMLGNVSEWVDGSEWVDRSGGRASAPARDEKRIRRGGAWSDIDPAQCAPTARKTEPPDYADSDTGFRLALSPES